MSVTKLIEQVAKDRGAYERLDQLIKKLGALQNGDPSQRYVIAGIAIIDAQLECGTTVISQLLDNLQEVQLALHDRITRNNKILSTADILVRGLASGSQDHEPE